MVAAGAFAQSGLPSGLETVGLDQRVGAQLQLDLRFADQTGAAVRLGDYFGERPVVIAPVYYDCPMLCTLTLEGLIKSLRAVELEPGSDFTVLAVSFDAQETPAQATVRRDVALERYGRESAAGGFHFLTGSESSVAALMERIGFGYRYDDETGEFGHVSTLVIATPEGVVSRYFPGIEYPPRDLRLSLVEAADERIGSAVDKVLLYCFKYDPTTGKYTIAIMNLVRAAGMFTLILMGAYVALNLRRERSRRAAAGARA